MIPLEVIQLAFKGGYEHPPHFGIHPKEEQLVCSALFWQALFKTFGKENKFDYFDKYDKEGVLHGELLWKHYAHQYFDLLLTGGDTEKFWKELLNLNDNDQTKTP